MTHRYESGTWSPYVGSGSIVLAVVLFLIVGILVYAAIRLRHPIIVKRTGMATGIALVVIWLLSVMTFLIAELAYGLALVQQVGRFIGPPNPITPVTETSALLAFIVIAFVTRRRGFWAAFGSAIVGTIAAPMIFELPFDLIVMWRTYPPTPATLYTLLFFLPLFLVEVSSFALLTLSPALQLSRYTLFFLAGMFLIFAVWALFGFAYPLTPLPTAFNILSKILAFATAISLFVSEESFAWFGRQFAQVNHEISNEGNASTWPL